MSYRVDLDIYNGPLDLLLYLIRREEVEITDIPIVRITEQYLAYLGVLDALDINVAGEFLVMAATLMEIKSRMLLPRPGAEVDDADIEAEEDPRLELVQQLLEYKRFKDAADDLGSLEEEQSRRYSRPPAQVIVGPEDQRFALDEMMKDVELWDLLNAFARVMKSINLAPREVIYDDTPIEDLGEQLIAMLRDRGSGLFLELFTDLFADYEQVSRSHLISAFLAVLECVRQRMIGIEQAADFDDLRLYWRGDEIEEDESVAFGLKEPPPEALVTSREAARESDEVDSPHGRISDDVFDTDEIQATEFDAELDAITVPEITIRKPIYTDDELMGRPEADAEPDEPTAGDDAETTDDEQSLGGDVSPTGAPPSVDVAGPTEDVETDPAADDKQDPSS